MAGVTGVPISNFKGQRPGLQLGSGLLRAAGEYVQLGGRPHIMSALHVRHDANLTKIDTSIYWKALPGNSCTTGQHVTMMTDGMRCEGCGDWRGITTFPPNPCPLPTAPLPSPLPFTPSLPLPNAPRVSGERCKLP